MRWSSLEAALPEMLGVAVVEDPLAVRKLGEVEVAAEIHFEGRGSLVAEGDVPGLRADAGKHRCCAHHELDQAGPVGDWRDDDGPAGMAGTNEAGVWYA